MAKKKPLEIDMAAGNQLRDTQGETLSVEGADITKLMTGEGRFNDNHGQGFFNSLGRVTEAKKIFGPEDCTDPRHTYYWEKLKAPYIYCKGLLYDDEDHPNARAAAAILRNIHKADSPLKLKASVEGGVIQRGIKDPSLLARTKIHSVALTFTPANNSTLVEPINLDKTEIDTVTDMALIKSVMHLAQEDVPSFRTITRDAQAEKVMENLMKMQQIAKDLGIEIDLDVCNKEELILKSLETKIAGNVEKINEMVKLLSKAVPPPSSHAYNIGTDIDEGTDIGGIKHFGYTGEDAKKAQVFAVKQMASHPMAHYEHRINKETGEKEPHVLMYHGVNADTGDHTGTSHMRGEDDVWHNNFAVKDGNVDHPTWGVHTWDPLTAGEYTSEEGGVHAFWVPFSSISHHRGYEGPRFKNPNFPMPDSLDESDRENMSDRDVQAMAESHIVVKPGQYQQASMGDITAAHNKIKSRNDRDPVHRNAERERSRREKEVDDEIDALDTKVGEEGREFTNEEMKRLNELGEKSHSIEQDVNRRYDTEPRGKLKDSGYGANIHDGDNRFYTSDGISYKGKLSKALTASYGGAGVPTNLTGGGVFQSESVEGSRGFNYITCHQCGKEEVYHDKQVKYRCCGRSIPFEDLFYAISKK